MEFEVALNRSIEILDLKFPLKKRQLEALNCIYKRKNDVIINLPVGYGKSLIYYLLPTLFELKLNIKNAIVIVITPLNIIQTDQLEKLHSLGISACKLNIRQCKETVEKTEFESGAFKITDVKRGRYSVVLCHPEALLNTNEGLALMGDEEFQQNVHAVVIDECHIVDTWGKQFRTAYKKLKTLPTFFPEAVFVAMSGTLTVTQMESLPNVLGFGRDFDLIQESPDRQNIFLAKIKKISCDDISDIYEQIYKPVCDELFSKGLNFPATILFIPMYYMSQAAAYLRHIFGSQDINTSAYSLIYSTQDKEVIEKTVAVLREPNPRIRLILATSAAGMGFDPTCIERIVHASPPRNLQQYIQEIGRAGRRGQKASAILHHSRRDVAKNLPGIEKDIINYCENESICLREEMLKTFGFEKGPVPMGCNCCDICKANCSCLECDYLKMSTEE